MPEMNNKTFYRVMSTKSYKATSPQGESNMLDFEMLDGLPSLLDKLSNSQKEALLNATELDETMLLKLSSKFIFANSCEDEREFDRNPYSSQSGAFNEDDQKKMTDVPMELQIQKVILLYVPIIIYFIGVVGNCLSFSVLIRRSMRRVSTYKYLAVLSVVDTVVLTLGLLQVWTGEVTGTSIRNYSDFSCKIVNVLGYTASDLSVWLIIAVTVERFIAVCYPLRAATTCRSKTAVKVITVLLLLMLLININFFWTTKIQIYESKSPPTLILTDSGSIVMCQTKYYIQKQCTAAEGYDFIVEKIWPWLDAVIYSFLPFIVIIILNSRIISRVLSARRKRCTMTTQLSTSSLNRNDVSKVQQSQMIQQEKSPRVTRNPYPGGCARLDMWKRDRQITTPQQFKSSGCSNRREANETNFMLSFMLLTISFAFLLMTLPMNIMLIINNIWNTSKTVSPSSADHQQWAKYQLASTITELLMYLNHSTNFFLYCATGQKFRIELKRMLFGTYSACNKLCCPSKRCSVTGGHGRRGETMEWSIHNQNQTLQDKSHADHTVIMNTITVPIS